MAKTILCFGSEVALDDTPFRICESLRNNHDFNFVKCDSPIDIMAYVDLDELVIIDNVKGLKRPRLFRSIEDFKQVESVTTHDIDIGTFLHVLEGMGKLKSVSIIGLPHGSSKSEIMKDLKKILTSQL
ncbi:MAG: hypothetical protein JSV63_00990 [Candidatus Aenigmatarchaeota archaeon]|nr:MAG: hypothetical protein JSV63_00990 [Candidatus Aenigmarchaeota archaeon]